MTLWSEENKVQVVLDPALDVWAGSATGSGVHLENYKRLAFLVPTGSSDTDSCGTATITVNSAISATGDGTDFAFKYRTCSSGGVHGTLTDATSTGFTTTQGRLWSYIIEVDPSTAASAGTNNDFDFVKISFAEVVNKPVTGCVIAVLSEPRYPQAILQSST